MKTIHITGTRPNYIKAAIVSSHITTENIIIDTGQHYDDSMSKIFFDEFKMNIKYDLNTPKDMSRTKRISMMVKDISTILFEEKPDIVHVYGDTDTSLAGALATKQITNNIILSHVEAGTRCGEDIPEEFNRICIDRLANLNFCPTREAIGILEREGMSVLPYGDVTYDLFLKSKELVRFDSKEKLPKSYVLVTIHRVENTDNKDNLIKIITSISSISEFTNVIFIMHPRTKKAIHGLSLRPWLLRIKVIDPVDYLSTLFLEENSNMIITDSGGIQREAYFWKKPCIVVRSSTEWNEIVGASSILTSPIDLFDTYRSILHGSIDLDLDRTVWFGSGNASKMIADFSNGK
jgi:UDP-GlcNAc3NAcA epimerase